MLVLTVDGSAVRAKAGNAGLTTSMAFFRLRICSKITSRVTAFPELAQ